MPKEKRFRFIFYRKKSYNIIFVFNGIITINKS